MGFLSAQQETCKVLIEKNGELRLPGGWAKYLKDHGQGTGGCFLKIASERARKKFEAENTNDKGGRIANKSANNFLRDLDHFFKSRGGKNTYRKYFFNAVMRTIPDEHRLSAEDWTALTKRTSRAKKEIRT